MGLGDDWSSSDKAVSNYQKEIEDLKEKIKLQTLLIKTQDTLIKSLENKPNEYSTYMLKMMKLIIPNFSALLCHPWNETPAIIEIDKFKKKYNL